MTEKTTVTQNTIYDVCLQTIEATVIRAHHYQHGNMNRHKIPLTKFSLN